MNSLTSPLSTHHEENVKKSAMNIRIKSTTHELPDGEEEETGITSRRTGVGLPYGHQSWQRRPSTAAITSLLDVGMVGGKGTPPRLPLTTWRVGW